MQISYPSSQINNSIKYRPDIDGLRAVAVSLVVIFHAVPSFITGGFIGVDVFFVISGYLITSIIADDLYKKSFSFKKFYMKRILRIFPALIIVLIACLLIGYFTLLAREFKSLGKHVVAGATYVSNFVLMNESGYFDIEASNKTLLHLWSLAIEEQFYLVWPVVMALTINRKGRPLVIVGVGIILSFALCIGYTRRLPDVVFYTPLTRCWELFVGAIIPFISKSSITKFNARIAHYFSNKLEPIENGHHIISVMGILIIIFATLKFDSHDIFPYWRAILPCLGAGLIILAGPQAIANRWLGKKLFVYIGLISYPLYLWHWPVLYFARILTNNQTGLLYAFSAIILSVIAAALTYQYVEKRVRSSVYRASLSFALFTSLILIGAVGYLIVRNDGFVDRYPELEVKARNIDSYVWNEEGYNNSAECVKLLSNHFTQYCNIMNINDPATIVLVGDSTANHFYHGLSVALKKMNGSENLLQIGKGGCPPLVDIEAVRETGKQECGSLINEALLYIKSKPSVHTVMLTMTGASYINDTVTAIRNNKDYYRLLSISEPKLIDPYKIIETGLRKTIAELKKSDKKIIFLLSAPLLPSSPSDCINIRPHSFKGPRNASCNIALNAISDVNASYRGMILKILTYYPEVKVWDPYNIVCNDESCMPVQEGIPLYRDNVHLSIFGSEFIGNRLLSEYSF